MKTREFAVTPLASEAHYSGIGLLCRTLRSPAEVSFFSPIPELSAIWRPARRLWEQNDWSGAYAALEEIAQQNGHRASVSIPTLFLMAHLGIEDDKAGADRCLHSALKQLGHQAETSEKSALQRRFRLFKDGETEPYSICGREWLVLAIRSLLENDRESCLRWIQQAFSCTTNDLTAPESPQRLQLIGDSYAVLACVAASSDEMIEAEDFLATAYQRHVQGEAFQSACRDLILTSRLAVCQGQLERYQSLLDAAECQLIMSATTVDIDQSPLMKVIHGDRMQLA